ncbi:YkgJ family cysteine cluster protein [Clostridium sp. CF012]|uniref:YkgJ family cysteine cluster protein n=1 Tax=Clostridium sp. CF012 TaxID=2843319 RepID=UPI001C0AD3B4|nr:YkgJ family cysteine cluster protein [Clostridium sp. CF012]MBU3142391.1 YkgJ family cysteine cluster protein [Clostridium sp. CF012]
MSGKKKNFSHPDIHEESQASAKLKIYSQLEYDLKTHRQTANGVSLCVPGCSDCCFDYFTIQSIEFDLILNDLSKWDEEKLNNLIKRVDKYWIMLENEYPEATRLFLNVTDNDIEKVNSSIEKTSLPCIFLDVTTQLCQIYNFRPFKCRIFGTTYYFPQPEEGAMGIACHRYGSILNDDNFDAILCDVTELLDENTDLSIIHDKKRNVAVLNPEYPLIYYLYQHFIVKRLGVSIVNFDEKFKKPRSTYYNTLINNKIR